MTDCSSIHGSSTSSGDMNSHHRAISKIRTIRLLRPHSSGNRGNLTLGHSPFSSFGFSLRGGREFGTGFFISSVVKGSEADLKGLQVGDQIFRVGGSAGSYRVDDAVHKELSQFIINQDRLTLKVRGECGEQWHSAPQNNFSEFITSLARFWNDFWYFITSLSRLKFMTNGSSKKISNQIRSVTVWFCFLLLSYAATMQHSPASTPAMTISFTNYFRCETISFVKHRFWAFRFAQFRCRINPGIYNNWIKRLAFKWPAFVGVGPNATREA